MSNTHFRNDIHGLRAVAVIAVLLYHINPDIMPGGFTGVDVFFVISGFLISYGIIKKIDTGNFSLIDFYERRMRRIVPALLGAIIVSIALAVITFPSDLFSRFGITVLFSALHVSNWLFMQSVDYFDIEYAFQENSLLHTWSLGIEVQIYLCLPLLFLIAYKRVGPRFFSLLLLLLSLLSLLYAEYLILHNNSQIAFYSPFTRFWEFGLGGLLALLPKKNLHSNNFYVTCSALGLAAIVFGFFVGNTDHFPGIGALLPCVGTALVLYGGIHTKDSIVTRIGSLRSIALIGTISYSLYLFHVPIITFGRYAFFIERPSIIESLLLTLLSFICTLLSYWYIEGPFRKKSLSPIDRKQFFAIATVSTLLVGLVGFSMQTDALWNWRLQTKAAELLLANNSYSPHIRNRKRCGIVSKSSTEFISNFFTNIDRCIFGDKTTPPSVLVIGDSHLYHAIGGQFKIAKNTQTSFYAIHTNYMARSPSSNKNIAPFKEKMLSFIESENITHVVLSHRNLYADFGTQLELFAQQVTSLDAKVLFVGQMPTYSFNIHRCLERQKVLLTSLHSTNDSCVTASRKNLDDSYLLGKEYLEQIAAKHENIFFWDPTPYFCTDDLCHAVRDSKLLYRHDPKLTNHLNDYGIEYVGQKYYQDLKETFFADL